MMHDAKSKNSSQAVLQNSYKQCDFEGDIV